MKATLKLTASDFSSIDQPPAYSIFALGNARTSRFNARTMTTPKTTFLAVLFGFAMTLVLSQSNVHADETDLFERMAREATARPMTYEQAKAIDANLEAFRRAMGHVARPWTFEKLQREYQEALWPAEAPGTPDTDWESRYERIRLFVSLMGETRDPRAFITLLDALAYPHNGVQRFVAATMAANFLDDPRYQPVPPPPQVLKVGRVNLRKAEERVREWWHLNETTLRRNAADFSFGQRP